MRGVPRPRAGWIRRRALVLAGLISSALYLGLALAGDLKAHLPLYLGLHGLLCLTYLGGLWAVGMRGDMAPIAHGTRRRADQHERLHSGRADHDRSVEAPPEHPRQPAGEAASAAEPPAATLFPRAGWIVAVFAVVFRLLLLAAPPSLSDDVYRYAWDARVQAHGVNPYRFAPDSAALAFLRDADWARVNHREIPTAYPPLMEILFCGAGLIGLGARGLRILFCLFDGAVALVLARLFEARGRPPVLALAYAWHPLVVVEVASSGHGDVVGLALLVVSTLCLLRGERARSGLAYGASVAARWLPLALLPVVMRRLRLGALLLGLGLVAALALVYARPGVSLFTGLGVYAVNWDYNSVVFPLVREVCERMVPAETLTRLAGAVAARLGDPAWREILFTAAWPATVARAILGLAMLAGAILIGRRVADPVRALGCAIGLLLVLSPTLHPWYVLWILPFAVLTGSGPWMLFSLLVPLSYVSAATADGRVPLWALAIEYGAPCALLAWRALRGRSGGPL